MALTKEIIAKLPKAKLFRMEFGGYYKKPYFDKFRGANFIRWQIWWFCVHHRAPWLERSARQNHPHLFNR